MSPHRILRIEVVGVGTPPLPLRPLVDEILRALEWRRKMEEPSGTVYDANARRSTARETQTRRPTAGTDHS